MPMPQRCWGACRPPRARCELFAAAFGTEVLADPQATLAAMGEAIAAFEKEGPEFHPFTSKYDYWLAGKATLSAAEQRGIALFNNPGKGNCNACHPSSRQQFSEHALFTDFSYDNIGVPRNWNIPANQPNPVSPISGVPLDYLPAQTNLPADAQYAYYDMGLCGPFEPPANDPAPRQSFNAATGVCGAFKVPSLRNVAITAPYFHNGNAADLHKALQFYITRDINNNQGNNPFWVPAGAAERQSVPGGGHLLPQPPTARRTCTSTTTHRWPSMPTSTSARSRTRRRSSPAASSPPSRPPRSTTWSPSCAR